MLYDKKSRLICDLTIDCRFHLTYLSINVDRNYTKYLFMFQIKLVLPAFFVLFLCLLSCKERSAENKAAEATQLADTHNLSPAFWDYAVSSNMLQVELGQLASEKGTNPQVKKWGKEAATYHVKAMQELKAIGLGHDAIVLPDSLIGADKTMVQEFSSLQGAEFDTRYQEHLAISYKAQLQRYQEALQKADGPKIVEWLTNMQQHLREKLQEITVASSMPADSVLNE